MPSLVFRRESSRRPQLFRLEDRLAPAAWVSQGPGPTLFGQAEGMTAQNNPVSGSIHAVVAHPTNANILWAGTVNGGIWKTTNATSASPMWTPLTDEFAGLSTGALALDPTDATSNTLVAGIGRFSSIGGDGGPLTGLLRTTDGGSNWTAITGGGSLTGKNISGVAVRGSTIVISVNYAETYTYPNVGIFRSTNGGNTFTQVTSASGLPGGIAFDLATDPTDNAVLYTGIQYAGANDGIYKSTDTGATWTRVSNATMNALTTDSATSNIELTVGNTHNVFAGIINNGRLAGVFASANGGASWTTMDIPEVVETATTAITNATNASPIVITSANHGQATGDRVLIQNVLGNTAANGTWTITRIDANSFSLNGSSGNGAYTSGGTWRAIQGLEPIEEDEEQGGDKEPEPGSDFPPGSQGGTHFSIVADPITSTIVYVGGDRQPLSKGANTGSFPNAIGANNYSGRLFRGDSTLSAGSQWTPLTHNFADPDGAGAAAGTAPHADSRDMTFDAAGNIIEVDDGGIYKRTLPRLTTGVWSSLHGDIRNTEFHSVAYDHIGNVIIGGTQDTGTPQQTTAGGTTWTEVTQGDGGKVAVDDITLAASNQSIRYSGYQNFGGFVRKTYNASNTLIGTVFPALSVGGFSLYSVDGNIQFYQQYELNAVKPSRGVIGTHHLYESADKFDTLTDRGDTGNDITTMAYGGYSGGVPNEEVLYYGIDGTNDLYLRTTAGGAFTNLTAYPGGRPQDIILDPDDWNTAYVIDDTSVYRTLNAGVSWTNISGNLASLVGGTLRTITYVNAASGGDGIVVGAAGGVFAAGVTAPTVWTVFGPNLPNAVAYDLKYDATDDVLLVGTLGRGAWTLPAASLQFGVSPVVTIPGGLLAYTENDPATVLDPAAAVSDFDSADFNTGSLTVDFSSNGSVDDRLAVRNQGAGAGQIGVSGANVTFGGATIGTVAGGVGLTPLTVTFTSALATPAAASALLKNITYANVSDSPTTATRTVRFVVNDGHGNNSSPATSLVTVTAVNDLPTAQASAVTTDEDTGRSFTASDFHYADLESDGLVSVTISALVLGAGDTLTVNQGAGPVAVANGMTITAAQIPTMTYQPSANASGSPRASFTFTVNDAGLGTVPAAMSINVTAVNDVPVANPSAVATSEDIPRTFTASNFLFSDVEGDPRASITIGSLALAPGDTLKLGGTDVTANQTITVANIPNLTYSPAANQFGDDRSSFTFTVNDAGLGTVAATMTINVDPVNDAPVATASAVTTDEDTARSFTVSDFHYADLESDGLVSVTISSLVLGAGDTLTVNQGAGPVAVANGMTITAAQIPTMTYQSPANASGAARTTFAFRVNDTSLGTVAATMTINVNPVNDAPVATASAVTTDEDTARSFAVSDFHYADLESDGLVSVTISALVLGAGDTLTVNQGAGPVAVANGMTITAAQIPTMTYQPSANESGADRSRFGFTVNDAALGTVAATMTIDVTSVNDSPSFVKGGDVFADKNAGAVSIPWATAVSVGPPDESGQTPNFLVTADNPALFSAGPAIAADGTLTFSTATDVIGATTVRVRLHDTGGGAADTSEEQTFQVIIGLNRAPTLTVSGNPLLTPVAVNSATASVSAVGDFATIGAADADTGTVLGVAVTDADTAHGQWAVSMDAGQSWQSLPLVSLSDTFLLRPQDLVRFTPAGDFVGKATLGYHAWDQSTGNAGDTPDLTGGQTGGFTAFSSGAGTAILRVAPVSISQMEDKKPAGKAVGVRPEVADVNGPVQKPGIAVIGAGGQIAGRWEFSAGGAWKPFAALDPSHATLLRDSDKVRFVPTTTDQFGDVFLAYRAWDQSAGKAGTTADLTSAASVDGATPFSGVIDYLYTRIAADNDRPILDVAAVTALTRVPPAAADPAGDLVSSILGATVTDPDPGTIPGLAVTAAGNTGGTWEYELSTDLGNWRSVLTPPPVPPVPALSPTSALLLGPDDRLRFKPNSGFGGETTISFKAWDRSAGSGSPGARAKTTAGTAFSAGVEKASLQVTADPAPAPNHAPVLASAPPVALTAVLEDTTANSKPKPAGDSVNVMLGASSDVDLTPKKGIAVTGLAGVATGAWQYSLDGKAWKPVGAASEANALMLRDTDHLRYLPAKNFTGAATVTFRAWDQTRGTAGQRADLALAGTTDGASPFSAGVATATIAVTPVNDAPVLNTAPKPAFASVAPGATNPTGDLVSKLLGTALTDVDANALQGIAVIGAPTVHGTWQFRLGAGAWTDFDTVAVSPVHALFLRDTDGLRFKPAVGFTGAVSLKYRGWDQTDGPGFGAFGTTAGLKSLSVASETATVAIPGVPHRPVLDTKSDARLPAVLTGDTDPAGTTPAELLGSAVTDPDIGALQGIAITAVDNTHGTWEFSLNNGASWNRVPSLTESKALLLKAASRLRFKPDVGYFGTATVAYKAWDESDHRTVGTLLILLPSNTAYSTAFETATVVVNTAPTVTY